MTTPVRIPRERWGSGPIGTRVQVIDVDSSIGKHYGAHAFDPDRLVPNPTAEVLDHPDYQACNLFATAMATIGQFERALGRRVAFATDTHQIKLAPHAFVGANAYYDRWSEAVVFGYFRGEHGAWVDTSLSYDVVVHEMSHAILDGLRPRFSDPSSPDQAAFHEAFADIVAVLSTLTRREVVEWALQFHLAKEDISASEASMDQVLSALTTSFLGAIAPQLGAEMPQRQRALRASFDLLALRRRDPSGARRSYPERKALKEPHGLGEVLVVSVLAVFRELLIGRLCDVMPRCADGAATPIELVADETSRAADLLLTLCIQAVDYTPPVHMQFADYLSSLLTVHRELHGTSGRLDVHRLLVESFASFGIEPAKGGPWKPFEAPDDHDVDRGPSRRVESRLVRFDQVRLDRNEAVRFEYVDQAVAESAHRVDDDGRSRLDYTGVRFDQIQSDRDEAFRFVFANQAALDLDPEAYTRVLSVRPSSRVSPDDGFIVRETVIEVLQRLRLTRAELCARLQVDSVGSGKADDVLNLRGGTTLILGDHGQVKYSIHKRLIPGRSKQDAADRIDYVEQLEQTGWVTRQASAADFAELHRLVHRAGDPAHDEEAWS